MSGNELPIAAFHREHTKLPRGRASGHDPEVTR